MATEVLRTLPNHLNTLVETKLLVGRDYRNAFGKSLGNDLAVKRVAVVMGQAEQMKGVVSGIRKNADLKIGDARHGVLRGEIEFFQRLFDGDLRKRNGAHFPLRLAVLQRTHRFL